LSIKSAYYTEMISEGSCDE